jgi:hypothetical protein
MPESRPVEIELEITPDGTAATWWWTEEADQILSALGPPAPGFEEVNLTSGVGKQEPCPQNSRGKLKTLSKNIIPSPSPGVLDKM